MTNYEEVGTEAAVVADLAARAAQPAMVDPDDLRVAVVPTADGDRQVLDLEPYADSPRRKRGVVTVRDAASFVAYLGRHELPGQTEIYADPAAHALVAVIDDHAANTGDLVGDAGWGQHRVLLGLVKTPAWTAWEALNGRLMGQQEFAEHLEQRMVDVLEPPGADMLELAQTFHATKSAAFESSQRLSTGEIELGYKEQVSASAGRSGRLSVPETFVLALAPFEGGQWHKVRARFRYRLRDAQLLVGYVLERPEDVLRAVFDQLVDEVRAGTEAPVYVGRPRPL